MCKDNCEWSDTYVSLYAPNGCGRDQQLTIDNTGIMFDSNTTLESDTSEDVNIQFLYCPLCGQEIGE